MIKTLVREIKEYKRDSIITPVFMIFEVIFETIIPFLMGRIIDIINEDTPDLQRVYFYGFLMLIFAGCGLFTGIMGGKYGARASAGFAKNLRKKMFENIQTFSFANIDKYSTSSLVTRLTTDVTNIQNAYQMVLRMCMRAPSSVIIAMAFSFGINAKLASVYLVAVILLMIILLLIILAATKYFNQAFPKYDKLNESVQENVTAIRVVKGFVREERENNKFKKASQDIYNIFVKAEKVITYNMPIMQFTVYACILLISYLGACMIVDAAGNPMGLTTGDLTSLLNYCMNILMSLMMVSMAFVMLMMSEASANRIAEVLNEESSLHNPEHPVFEIEDGSIEFRNVLFRYTTQSEEPVLSEINLSIKSGETIGIIGGTGSSKTSLVNLISRLYDVNEGEVLVGGRNVKEYDLTSLRNTVAVVLQKNVLFSGTILDNLRWGNKDASEEECIRACKLACADEFVQMFPDKYQTKISQGGTNVSGGQKQRLCIARALLKKPKILILDDSTSAVDTATDARIRKAFAEEIPDTTKIIIAQRISSVQNADRIVVMENGKISGVGTHEELLENNAIYGEVYNFQQNGSGDFDEVGGER